MFFMDKVSYPRVNFVFALDYPSLNISSYTNHKKFYRQRSEIAFWQHFNSEAMQEFCILVPSEYLITELLEYRANLRIHFGLAERFLGYQLLTSCLFCCINCTNTLLCTKLIRHLAKRYLGKEFTLDSINLNNLLKINRFGQFVLFTSTK